MFHLRTAEHCTIILITLFHLQIVDIAPLYDIIYNVPFTWCWHCIIITHYSQCFSYTADHCAIILLTVFHLHTVENAPFYNIFHKNVILFTMFHLHNVDNAPLYDAIGKVPFTY